MLKVFAFEEAFRDMMRLRPQGSPGTPLAAHFSKMLQTYYQSTWLSYPNRL
jgi:glutamine synthetase adenylyltransferase